MGRGREAGEAGVVGEGEREGEGCVRVGDEGAEDEGWRAWRWSWSGEEEGEEGCSASEASRDLRRTGRGVRDAAEGREGEGARRSMAGWGYCERVSVSELSAMAPH